MDESERAALKTKIAENERLIAEQRSERDLFERLAPIRHLRALTDQAMNVPADIDWVAAIAALEAALAAARVEVDGEKS